MQNRTHLPTVVRRFVPGLLLIATFALEACASEPPPPPATPAPEAAPAAPPAMQPMDESAAQPAAAEEAPPPRPECEANEDCAKARGDAPAGNEWFCDSGTCASRALPEPPKPEPVAETPKPGKSSKKGNKPKKGN
jgi:hypothetical protein